MKRSIPLLIAACLFLASLPLAAQCECAAGPCEEATLTSVAAENPELTGFGTDLEPVAAIRPSGMTLVIGHNVPTAGERFAATMFIGVIFLPFVLLVRRILCCGDPMLSLGVSSQAFENDGRTDPRLKLVREVSPESGRSDPSRIDLGSNVLAFPN